MGPTGQNEKPGHSSARDGHEAPSRRMVWVYPDNLRATIFAAPTLEVASALRDFGWQVDLLVGGDVPNERSAEIDGVEVYEIPFPKTFLIKQAVFHLPVARYVLSAWGSVDIVFFDPMSLPWMLLLRGAGLLRRGAGRPLLVMDTRTMPMIRSSPRDLVRSLYTDAMNHLANRLADGQTTITRALAQAYRMPAASLWGIWPSGVNTSLFAPAREKRRWPGPDDPVRLVFVGSLEEKKPLLPLCEAVEKANREGTRFELSLVGEFVGVGPAREEILTRAARSPESIRLLGKIPYSQVPDALAAAHLGVLASPDTLEYQTESPIKLFEYLGAGLPLLASRVSCHTEVIGDRPCVFWVDGTTPESFLSALRRVWKDRLSLAALGDDAWSLAPEYTWRASARKLSDALERGLARRGR
jgi:glycosyltransferase involved in cell wall biosynthesis